MAMDMDKAMNMSLDEYIASFKAERKMVGVSSNNFGNGTKFKRERSVEIENDDDDEIGDNRISAESSRIWKGPDIDTNYIDLDMPDRDELDAMAIIDTEMKQDSGSNKTQQHNSDRQDQKSFDLRSKISSSAGAQAADSLPTFNSQQWRIMRPNVMGQRPAGMPPLVPQNLFEERWSQNNSNNQSKRNRFQNKNRGNNRNGFNKNNNNNKFCKNNGDGYGAGNNNYHNGFNNNNNQYLNSNGDAYGGGNKNHINMSNNGRVQRFNQRNNNQDFGKNTIKSVLERLQQSNGHVLPQQLVRDLTIECSSDSIGLSTTPYPKPMAAMNNMMGFKVPSVQQNAGQMCSLGNNKSDSLRALLGIHDANEIKTDTIPMQASKILDFFQNISQQTTHKPIYDIKIQKEIHVLQKKQLLYKCPGGEVVSSDGTGVDCAIIPRTSGISLNHRFA